jgi:hypothetical protein
MTLTFDQKPVDLYVLSLYVGWDAPERRQFRRISNTLPILVLIGVAAWLIGGNEQTDWLLLGAVAVLAVASVFLMPRLVRWMQIRRIDNMIKRHPRPELLIGRREVTFDAQELRMQVQDQVSSYPYAGMTRWVELRDHYLIYVKPNVALVIPKSAFEGGEAESQMVDLLTQKLGQRRRHVA